MYTPRFHRDAILHDIFVLLRALCGLLVLGLVASAAAQEPEGDALPWDARQRLSEPILRPLSGPLEVLERYEIGPSQLDNFFSGQPITPAEEDVLVKILFRFPRLGLDNLERWRQQDVTWDQLAAAPKEHRAQVFRVEGRVQHVERHDLLAEQAELFEFDHYYRVTLALDDAPYQAVLLARHVPDAWPVEIAGTVAVPAENDASLEPDGTRSVPATLDESVPATLDERAAADALFLKLGDSMAPVPQLIFAAGRVGWYPDRPDPERGIGPSHVALASLGVDAGQWASVREANLEGLGNTDREAFYQVLAAVGRPEAAALQPATKAPLDVIPFLQQPEEHIGEMHRVRGTARRIMKVPVRDADVQARFGIDHYYEIDMRLPLGDRSLRFGKDPTGEKNPVYNNTFPATLNVRRLPPGLTEGENLHDLIEADAVFFRIWTYRSTYASQFGQLQPVPLFMALEPAVYRPESPANWIIGALVGAAFTLAVGVIAIVAFWYRRSDQSADGSRKQAVVPPDFSGLE